MTVPEMPAYQSHKTVWALKIAQIIVVGDDGTTDENLIVDIVFEDSVRVSDPRRETGCAASEFLQHSTRSICS